jgi:hypothetical protein
MTRKRKITPPQIVPEADDEDVHTEDPDDLAAMFDLMIDGRSKVSSKTEYKSIISAMKKMMADDPNLKEGLDSDGELILPMKEVHFKGFLDVLCKPHEKTGKHRAFSTIQGYISAIKFEYKKRNVEIDQCFVRALKGFSEGLKRSIAVRKANGEGKRAFTVEMYEELMQYAYKEIFRPVLHPSLHVPLLESICAFLYCDHFETFPNGVGRGQPHSIHCWS